MLAEIDTGGPRVLHNYECLVPTPRPNSIPQEERNLEIAWYENQRFFRSSDTSDRQRTWSESLLDLDSSTEVRRRRFRRSRRRSEVDEESKECRIESRIEEVRFGDDDDLRGRPELRDSFNVANQVSPTTCHVIADRGSYRYTDPYRPPKIGGFFFKLKGRFKSGFDPRISWTLVSSEISLLKKCLASSHPCSDRSFESIRSNPPVQDCSRVVKIPKVKVESDPVQLEIEPLDIHPIDFGIERLNLNIVEHIQILRDGSSRSIDFESTDKLMSVRKKKKRKKCSNNRSYFQLAFLLFLIAFGQSGLLTAGLLSFHGKSTGLGVLTIGMVLGAVGAAPVDLISDSGVRAERSANLSHITGASRKIQMYIKNRHLQILPDGTVNGSNDDTSDYTIFQRTSVSRGQLRIQGVATCLYLCMDSCGLLYGSHEYTEDCLFNETLEQHNYNTYSSVRWSTNRKTLYLGLNRHGEPRRVQAKGHNLGRLSAYARVLTQVAPPDRVEALQRRMLGAHHGVRHRHNAHHHRNQQQAICPRVLHPEKDNRDKFRCRKRKKRKKRKRKCREDEVPGPQCERRLEPGSSEGLPDSKRSCEGAASDEVCRRQALEAASKKRKSRMEKAGSAGRNQSTTQQKGSKKGKKQPSTKKPNSFGEHEDDELRKPDSMNGKKKAPGFKRTSLQAKKRLPGRTTSSAVPKEPPSTSPSSWLPGASTTGSTGPASADTTLSSSKVISGSLEDISPSRTSSTISREVLTSLADLSSSLDSSEDTRLDVSYSDEELQGSSSDYVGVTVSGASVEAGEDEGFSSTSRALGLIDGEHDEDIQKAVRLTMRERRFIKFASVEYDGQLYMTPQDFLESVVESQPRPRLKRRVLSDKELDVIKNSTPSLRHGSTHMFRNLRDKGILSYTEYLFLLSILTKPQTGFRIAFNMFDTDGNERVDKTEFLVIRRLFGEGLKERELDDLTKRALRVLMAPSEEALKARAKLRETHHANENANSTFFMEKIFSHAWRGRQGEETKEDLNKLTTKNTTPEEIQGQYIDDDQGLQRRHSVDTTLMIHFFGQDGKRELKYEGFRRFMENLQHEVLELEFHEFSKGHDTISELDFAKILLRYTYLDTDEYDKYLDRLLARSQNTLGINFNEFQVFYQFLNNLEDFSIAMRMYTLADHPISKDEFSRAVKICTGTQLSSHIIDTVFAIFDVDGDGQLSYKEFIAIMKDRLHRGFKSQTKTEGWDAMKFCIKQEMKAP